MESVNEQREPEDRDRSRTPRPDEEITLRPLDPMAGISAYEQSPPLTPSPYEEVSDTYSARAIEIVERRGWHKAKAPAIAAMIAAIDAELQEPSPAEADTPAKLPESISTGQATRIQTIVEAVDQITDPYLGEIRYVHDAHGLFIPTPGGDIPGMLGAAAPQAGETLIDFGSGDGRLIFAAAGALGVEAHGYEMSGERHRLALRALETLAANKILDSQALARVHLHQGDFFDADISAATIFTFYVLSHPAVPDTEQRFEEKLLREAPEGARVVVYGTGLEGYRQMTRLALLQLDVPNLRHGATLYEVRRNLHA